MRLIGLNARKEGGKDTAFAFIRAFAQERNQTAMRRAFADPLKISGMRALGFHKLGFPDSFLLEMSNILKENGTVKVEWDTISPITGDLIPQQHKITGRELWQFYGTEAHRADDLGQSFGVDFWVDNVLPLGGTSLQLGFDDPAWMDSFVANDRAAEYAVVTDVRFPNEAQRVLELGGEVWEIDSDTRIDEPRDDHPSEAPLPRDLVTRVIDNNGTLAEFERSVREALS